MPGMQRHRSSIKTKNMRSPADKPPLASPPNTPREKEDHRYPAALLTPGLNLLTTSQPVRHRASGRLRLTDTAVCLPRFATAPASPASGATAGLPRLTPTSVSRGASSPGLLTSSGSSPMFVSLRIAVRHPQITQHSPGDHTEPSRRCQSPTMA